ncbi:RING finger protein 214 [Megalops cyprinoides]|uniref:RING finger protein 214 n=1 Tax=Megalops cyprinoides TaxID=118141 RepID=UPI001863B613|nr:RING finger protein 214 [Megalops cyprinoides]
MEDDVKWSSALEEKMSHLDLDELSSVKTHEPSFLWHMPTISTPWGPTTSFQAEQQGEMVTTATDDQQSEQSAQTDPWTTESAVNTEPDWESLMRTVEEHSTRLALQYEALLKQQEVDQVQHEGRIKMLELRRDEGIQQQKALIDKIESLRGKLKLNCSKTTRRNFNSKRLELTAEKERLQEEKSKLAMDLERTDRKLASLIEEQSQEKQTWERELAELQKEVDRLHGEAEEANQAALRDEISALEMQREVTISQVEEWIAEAERYLSTLRLDVSQQHLQQRLDWEKNVAVVHSNLGKLQHQFNEQLQLLQRGHHFDSLPPVALPPLPQVPMLELLLGPMMNPQTRPFVPMQVASQPPPVSMAMPLPPQHHPPQTGLLSGPPRGPTQTVAPSPQHVPVSAPHPAPASKPTPTPAPQVPANLAPRAQPTPPPASNPVPSSSAQPAGKLDKLLDKLGARFPQCSRSQLISVLQQIKTSRSGTMAGLSIEELTQQVGQRLAQMERPSPPLGPVPPPSAARNFPSMAPQGQRTTLPPQGPPVAQVFQTRPSQTAASSSRKMCLMCQNSVEAGSQHDMSCSHVVHKECISVWLQSSKNNSCPFCPSK